MEIIFCKQCGRRIKQDELQNNQFSLVEDKHFCVSCLPITAAVPGPGTEGGQRRKSSAQMRPKTTSQSAVVRNSTGKFPGIEAPRPSSAHSIPTFKPKSDKSTPVALYAGIGLAALAALIGIAIFALQPTAPVKGPDQPNVVVNPPVPLPPTPPTVPPTGGPGPLVGVNVPPVPPVGAVDSAELARIFNADIQRAVRESMERPRPTTVTLCNAASTAPKLDGDLTDPCWTGAAVFQNFTDELTGQTAEAANEAVTLRLVHHQGVLYFAGEMQVPEGVDKLPPSKTIRDDSIWGEESVELFLAPPTAKGRYTQIMVNPKSTLFDMTGVLNGERNAKMNLPTLQAVAKQEGTRWSFELAVAAADLHGLPNGRWRFNACRNRVAAGVKAKAYCWKTIGSDFHCWPQFNEIEFAGAAAAEIMAVQDPLRAALPEYQIYAQVAAALKAHPLPFDALNIPAKPRAVTLPFCPAFTALEAGAAFDAPSGALSFFNTSATLRPAGEAGLLRFGRITDGPVAHVRLTARMSGGDAAQPRVLGLLMKSAPGAARAEMGLIGVVAHNGQLAAVAVTRPEGSTMTFNHAEQAPVWIAPIGASPLDLDFNAEPGAVKMYVGGRLAAVLPWTASGYPAADMVGLFTQNSGLDLYKFMATAGLVANTHEEPPLARVLSAPDWAAAPGASFELYADPSAALGLALATTQTVYAAAHGGQTLTSDSDVQKNPSAEMKLRPQARTPYRVYARIRNVGAAVGIAPKFWLQVGPHAAADAAGFAPGQAAAYLFQRMTLNARDWGWVALTHPQTRLPVELTFAADNEVTLRLITGTPDAALDQVLLLPAGLPLRGLEVNDDSCYVGGRLPPNFALTALQPARLPAANDVMVAKFSTEDTPVNVATGPVVPPPTGPAAGDVASADGFVSKVPGGAIKILPATDGLSLYGDQTGGKLALPPSLVNSHFFQGTKSGWLATQGAAFSFELKNDAMVFLALDPAQPPQKALLEALLTDGFERSSLLVQLSTPTATLQLIRRRFNGGAVRFVGHNLASVAPPIFVLPLDTTPRQPVDMTRPLERAPGMPADSYLVQLRADLTQGAVDVKKAATAVLHKVDLLPRTPIGQPGWVFHGIPASAGRNATDADAGYITLADSPAMNRKTGAISFWVYLGGNSLTKHVLLARKIGNQTRTLEIAHGGLASNFGDRIYRAKETIPSWKWTLVVWNFGPDGQQFIVDGKAEEWQAGAVDLSTGGEFRLGNDYQKNALVGMLAEWSVHDRVLDSALPPPGIPPALKLTTAMEKAADPGVVVVYGFDSGSGMPKEADLSGNGLDGVWNEYRGLVTAGPQAVIGAERDRTLNLKRGAKGNPYLTVPQDPNLELTSGSIYLTINLDKTALKKVTGDANRCHLIEQINGARTDQIYFGDTLTNGFYFSVLSSKAGAATTPGGQVKASSDMEGGLWYQVAFTWTPTTLRYYQNGKMIDQKTNTGFKLDGKNKALVFFGQENDLMRGFVGAVGELKVYSFARTVWE